MRHDVDWYEKIQTLPLKIPTYLSQFLILFILRMFPSLWLYFSMLVVLSDRVS